MAETEELIDEHRRLCDVKPFGAVLKIIERKDDKAEKILNGQITRLIGKGMYFILFYFLYKILVIIQ